MKHPLFFCLTTLISLLCTCSLSYGQSTKPLPQDTTRKTTITTNKTDSLTITPAQHDTASNPSQVAASDTSKNSSTAAILSFEKARIRKIQLDSIKRHRDSTQVLYFNNDFETLGALNLRVIDTAITGFQNYDPLYKTNRFYATLGNMGHNYRSLLPTTFSRQSGFDYGIHSFDQYLYQNDSIKYYKVEKTYTELWYTQGPKKEQNFHAVFSRNIFRTFNLGFDFKVGVAPGAYIRQKTNHVNFVLTAQYFTKNKRYGVIANFITSRLRNYENGGIKYDSAFEENIQPTRNAIEVNLQSAQNRIREIGFYMKHYFNLSRHAGPSHTKSPDSLGFIELGRITYSFNYKRQIQNFIDAAVDSSFWPEPILDPKNTFDSLTHSMFINEVVWSNPSFLPDKKLRILQIEAGIRQEYHQVAMHGIRHSFVQFIPNAAITFNPYYGLRLEAHGEYVLGDYNEADFNLSAKLSLILGRRDRNAGTISFTGDYALQEPGWFYQKYQGNFFMWDTTWLKTGTLGASFAYNWKFLETGVKARIINNFVYLNTLSEPQQEQAEFIHLYAYANVDLNLWRFNIRAQLAYQSVQGTPYLRLPAFMGNVAIYYTQRLFRGAATLQPGVNVFYNTPYYADAYNPSLRSFHLQNDREIGNYPYMDVFINLKVQRARFFVTYTHFNAGLMSYTYYTTPTYPMQDGAFKFGVSWRFHD